MEKPEKEIGQILQRRRDNHPTERSAGCVFKNVNGRSAGRLIEEIGLKGKTIGEAQISEKHANFLINNGKAKANQIIELIDIIKKKAFAVKKIKLEPEIYFWGFNGR